MKLRKMLKNDCYYIMCGNYKRGFKKKLEDKGFCIDNLHLLEIKCSSKLGRVIRRESIKVYKKLQC